MTPPRNTTAVKLSEDQIQAQCITWFRMQYRQHYWRLYSVPNGGKRNKTVAAKLKQTGTLSGVWDLFLCIPVGQFSGLYVEMKAGRNGLTDNQIEFMEANKDSYAFEVCKSLDEFRTVVNAYLQG